MTLEQKIIRGLREGNQAVVDGLRLGVFGETARLWFEGEIVAELERRVAASRPEIEDFTSPP